MKYDPQAIEKKWQKHWDEVKAFKAENYSDKPKYYPLVEFPYPSGQGLHIGHPRSYTALDIVARKKRMEGYNVLYCMGWDAFGLPTENFAIKNKIHPRLVTERNIANFKKQLKSLGLSIDWDREINTTDPEYYKWTQWIFLKLFEHGLAYKKAMTINWCPSCKIGLANEEVVQGCCERCGATVVQRPKEQWMLKITDYAEKLLDGLDHVDFIERVKTQQRNWIGKSVGAEIEFELYANDSSESSQNVKDSSESSPQKTDSSESSPQKPDSSESSPNKPDSSESSLGRRLSQSLRVFTSRPDTIYGTTYMVISPEHPLLEEEAAIITNMPEIKAYQEKAAQKSDFERSEMNKDKDGVKIEGITARNPISGAQMPVFVSDYVLMSYGTGAIMSVPAHDERDYEFAKKFDLPIIRVIKNDTPDGVFDAGETGVLINSPLIDGLEVEEAKNKIIEILVEKKLGQKKTNYKLRDWVFSRQRYWGEPIPLVYCEKHGWQAIPESELPLELPDVENYEPTDDGESPLSKMTEWCKATCPVCGGPARRETDTMPQWAGSSWYYMRYCDPHNKEALADRKLLDYWIPVDWYNGGMEHTTLHLLYSRFWHHFLYDIGVVGAPEPYMKRTSHGMILGENGVKMSKSRGNVVSPDVYVDTIGADSLRIFEMFIGDFEKPNPWSDDGARGSRRYLDRVWQLMEMVEDAGADGTGAGDLGDGGSGSRDMDAGGNGSGADGSGKPAEYLPELETIMHQTIKKVSSDYDTLKFNTAIAQLMTLLNEIRALGRLNHAVLRTYLILLNPVAPHITEEMWQLMGYPGEVREQPWPKYDEAKTKSDTYNIAISINGKFKLAIELDDGLSKDEVIERAKAEEKIVKQLEGKTIVKTIFVPKKMVNFVIK